MCFLLRLQQHVLLFGWRSLLHQCSEPSNMYRRCRRGRSVRSLHDSIHRNGSVVANKHIHLLVCGSNTGSDTDSSCPCSMYHEFGPVFLRDYLLCGRSKMCCRRHMYALFIKLRCSDFSSWFRPLPTHERRNCDNNKYSFCHHDCTIHSPCNSQWKQPANPIRKQQQWVESWCNCWNCYRCHCRDHSLAPLLLLLYYQSRIRRTPRALRPRKEEA